ncbi:hypothetical protein [Citrobacter sp. Cf141]|uniref:hypothetical protein n=1 Tax=Citrobacter sp. Cf141 TaxID=2985084 RepID=UPI0025784C49|nr:hypothetical protein [Citrobacter sp. Cf141]MDM3083207.1 hypothetical protein [Citrobacter sp. Cf141]
MKSFNIETPSEAKIDVTPHSFTPEMVKTEKKTAFCGNCQKRLGTVQEDLS